VKIKLDENIAASAGPRLAALGFDVDTVLSEGLTGKTDREVWAAAQAEARLLVTQDLDFSDTRVFAAGTHAGLFIVRLPDTEQWGSATTLLGGSRARRPSLGNDASWSRHRTSSECSDLDMLPADVFEAFELHLGRLRRRRLGLTLGSAGAMPRAFLVLSENSSPSFRRPGGRN
jgi:predicted nuclease of predicted toxin-antitoxin system